MIAIAVVEIAAVVVDLVVVAVAFAVAVPNQMSIYQFDECINVNMLEQK